MYASMGFNDTEFSQASFSSIYWRVTFNRANKIYSKTKLSNIGGSAEILKSSLISITNLIETTEQLESEGILIRYDDYRREILRIQDNLLKDIILFSKR